MRKRLSNQWFIAVCILVITGASLWLTGCAPQGARARSPLPTPQGLAAVSPLSQPSDFQPKTYTQALTSPNGRMNLTLECTATPTNYECWTAFPNGDKVKRAITEAHWSPDSRFAVTCGGISRDGCQGYEVWDIANSKLIGGFGHFSWYQWLPDKEHTLAYIEPGTSMDEKTQLKVLDAVTGEETYPQGCPSWLQQLNPTQLSMESRLWFQETCDWFSAK
jgi:hypothetical protein